MGDGKRNFREGGAKLDLTRQNHVAHLLFESIGSQQISSSLKLYYMFANHQINLYLMSFINTSL
jgi:hypothetical protein